MVILIRSTCSNKFSLLSVKWKPSDNYIFRLKTLQSSLKIRVKIKIMRKYKQCDIFNKFSTCHLGLAEVLEFGGKPVVCCPLVKVDIVRNDNCHQTWLQSKLIRARIGVTLIETARFDELIRSHDLLNK